MTSIRKFAYAALLAATTLNFLPQQLAAQETARGHFTLTHDVRWGSARVPAGNYEFSFDPNSIARILSLKTFNGARASFMMLVPSTDSGKPADTSLLVLEGTPSGSYVSAMQLPEFGMTLHFTAPSRATERQIAEAATTASASGQ